MNFSKKGSIQYVGSEIRAVILNKMMVDTQDDVCVIGGESIAIETALLAPEGTVIAVEYSATDRDTMEENVDHFGLQNVKKLLTTWMKKQCVTVRFLRRYSW